MIYRRIIIFAPEFRQHLIALTVACAMFMEMLDGSVIATALPQMARPFHENPVNLGIGISAYMLTLAIFIPSSGWMADRFGAKTIFLSAIALFTIGVGAVRDLELARRRSPRRASCKAWAVR